MPNSITELTNNKQYMISIEKNEQFALINVDIEQIDTEFTQSIEKKVVVLFREGYTNFILNILKTTEIETATLLLIKKIEKLSKSETGMLVICTENETIIEELDGLKLDDLVIMATIEEAKEAIYMHELENDFRQEESEEEEYGEEGSSSDYE